VGSVETDGDIRVRVLELISEYDESTPGGASSEPFGSMQAAWLIHVLQERWDVEVDLTDSVFERLQTVDGVVDVLREYGVGSRA